MSDEMDQLMDSRALLEEYCGNGFDGELGYDATGETAAISEPTIRLRPALEIAATPLQATWLLKPYIERAALILAFGAEGTLKSFVALHWALCVAALGHTVVYLHAEGRGLWKRLRAWCLWHRPQEPWTEVLGTMPFHAAERPLNLSSASVIESLTREIDKVGTPAFVVVDTMTRNSDGKLEKSNEDATAYLNQLDTMIRARYGSSVLFVHHVGHTNRERARGPFSLTASTDANFRFDRPDPSQLVITVTSGRMKDCEPPPPFGLRGEVVQIPGVAEEDGNPVTSLAVQPTIHVPAAVRKAPSGKNQQLLLGAIREHVRSTGSKLVTSIDLAAIANAQQLRSKRLPECRKALVRDGWICESVGGITFLEDPPQ
jgi:hypothetical protein